MTEDMAEQILVELRRIATAVERLASQPQVGPARAITEWGAWKTLESAQNDDAAETPAQR